MKALIFYGTRYGATRGTSEEIAKILREEDFDVKVVNAQEEKVRDISGYGLVIVGSGIACGRWVNEAEDFLKKFHKEFEHKKLALFVSSWNRLLKEKERRRRLPKFVSLLWRIKRQSMVSIQ